MAVATLYAQSGRFTEAEQQFQQAKKLAPNDLRVLLGYAMLKDQMNQPEEALKFYKEAEQKHPKEASVYNDLAVHYARHDMTREAIEAAQHAVDLRPREARYRNNLAALLVEAGMPQEAFKQLRQVYDEPVAHYDLGFLLNKRGLKSAALQEFTMALQMNPGMTLARQWVERLSRERDDGRPAVIGMMLPPGQAPARATPNLYAEVPPPAAAPLPPPPQHEPPLQFPTQTPPVIVQFPAPPPALLVRRRIQCRSMWDHRPMSIGFRLPRQLPIRRQLRIRRRSWPRAIRRRPAPGSVRRPAMTPPCAVCPR